MLSNQQHNPRSSRNYRSKKESLTIADVVPIDAVQAVAMEVRPNANAKPVINNTQGNVGNSRMEEKTAIAILKNLHEEGRKALHEEHICKALIRML